MRPLSHQEIQSLEHNHCQAQDWQLITVAENFSPDSIYNVCFIGNCQIGSTSDTVTTDLGIELPSGIRNARIINSSIGDNCLIENICGYIYNADIEDNCVICNVFTIQTTEGTTFGQGNTISVMNEAGDGNVVLFSALTSQIAAITALPPFLGDQYEESDSTTDRRRQAKEAIKRMVMEEVTRTIPKRTRIETGARILSTDEITNSWIGAGTEIRGARRISESTLTGEPDNGVFIGAGVICDGCVVTSGSSIDNNAIAKNCFIGECSTLTDGFSATDSLFFANSFMANGEACAAFCGPFSVNHHKSTLLIGGMYSFYNAGSATNFSNHAYKMGPIHYGILEHGAKTASGAHILWPARIGAFSMCMGKIATHPDSSAMPFSYVIGDGTETYIVPGRNIATVGTYRDVMKWPKRDARPEGSRHSIVETSWLNVYTVSKIVEAKNKLEYLIDHQGKNEVFRLDDGSLIKKPALTKGISLYSMAIKMYLAEWLDINSGNESCETYADINGCIENIYDLSGMVICHDHVLQIVNNILNGNIDTTATLSDALAKADAERKNIEKAFALKTANDIYGWQSLDNDDKADFLANCRSVRKEWLNAIAKDAEREYQLGDVDRDTLDKFISKLA